jgi:hypothetical protein
MPRDDRIAAGLQHPLFYFGPLRRRRLFEQKPDIAGALP